jgi:hypothetical protein
MSALLVQILLLPDELQLLMLLVATLTRLETRLFLLIIFYDGTFLIIKILIIFNMNTFSHYVMVDVITQPEVLSE